MAILHQGPAPRPWRCGALAVASACALAAGLAWLVRPGSPLPARSFARAPLTEVAGAGPAVPGAARCDARCSAAKVIAPATAACAAAIEQLASYGVRWLDADAASPKFDRYAWLDEARGTLTLGGGRAEFSNAAGAYRAVDYECDVDPARLAVLDARVRPR